ncbi:hypothetical protein RFI_37613, partial [Reticulomyxa filosa]
MRSPLHQTISFKFLFTQFKILVDSKLLANKLVHNHSIQYKHEATKNAIEIAKELFCVDVSAKEIDAQFCLCKKWQSSKFFLINQDGSISLMISNENDVNNEEREFLKNAKFVLLCWKEEMGKLQQLSAWITVNTFVSNKQINGATMKIPSNEVILEEKEDRIKVLCQAVGVPEAKKGEIIKELCKGEFEHY